MKTFILLFIWFIVEFILWVTTVILVATKEKNENSIITARNEKYLRYLKTIAYITAVLFSMAIGYILK